MGHTGFDVDSGDDRKRPEKDVEVAINEHGSPHAFVCVVMSFGLPILLRSFRDCPFILDTFFVTEFPQFPLNILGGIIHSEENDFLTMQVFGHPFVLLEPFNGLRPLLH
jgi:hypothetical protein